MLDELRDRMARALAERQAGVLGAATPVGPCCLPVRYRAWALQVECLVPLWSEIAQVADESPSVLLVVLLDGGRWLQYRGRARPAPAPGRGVLTGRLPWGALIADLYVLLRLEPTRIELFDETRGWGVRETLDL